jgi:hypothetical protein
VTHTYGTGGLAQQEIPDIFLIGAVQGLRNSRDAHAPCFHKRLPCFQQTPPILLRWWLQSAGGGRRFGEFVRAFGLLIYAIALQCFLPCTTAGTVRVVGTREWRSKLPKFQRAKISNCYVLCSLKAEMTIFDKQVDFEVRPMKSSPLLNDNRSIDSYTYCADPPVSIYKLG